MDAITNEALVAIRSILVAIREGAVTHSRANYQELAEIANLCGPFHQGVIEHWIEAMDARSRARRTCERSLRARSQAHHARVRGHLDVIQGRGRPRRP